MKMGLQRGFTMAEALIVMVIIGILAAMAMPIYNDQIRKANRADAMAALTGFANAMEKHYTNNGTYLGAGDAGADTGAPAATVYANKSPVEGADKAYDLTIDVATTDTYVLRATPVSGHPRQDGDGIIEITSSGMKRWDRDDDGSFDAGDSCWQQSC